MTSWENARCVIEKQFQNSQYNVVNTIDRFYLIDIINKNPMHRKQRTDLSENFPLDHETTGFSDGASGNEPAISNAGDIRDMGLLPGLERSPGGEQGNPSSILAWKTPWTEEPGRLQSMGSQRVGPD